MKKLTLSKKQVLLMVWAVVLTALFIYIIIDFVSGLPILMEQIEYFKSVLFTEGVEKLSKSLYIIIVRIAIVTVLYVSATVLITQKIRLSFRRSTVENGIEPPAI